MNRSPSPVWPVTVHPKSPDVLRRLYQAWLAAVRPGDPKGRRVASSKNARGVARGEAWALETAAGWSALRSVWDLHPDNVWVWSDLHIGHANICNLANRPFASSSIMDSALLSNALERVGDDDWLLFLGDLSFHDAEATKAWLNACPGHKALVLGNHDLDGRWARQGITPQELGFEAVADVVDWHLQTPLRADNGTDIERVWFSHYPVWSEWVPKNARNVHGHIHQHRLGGRMINASVENTGYAPVRLRTLLMAEQMPTPWGDGLDKDELCKQ